MKAGLVLTGIGLAYAVGPTVAASVGIGGMNLFALAYYAQFPYRRGRIVARVPSPGGGTSYLRRQDVDATRLIPSDGEAPWGLKVRRVFWRDDVKGPLLLSAVPTEVVVYGDAAIRICAQIFAIINGHGAPKPAIDAALAIIEKSATSEAVFARAARLADKPSWTDAVPRGSILNINPDLRLALEMVANSDFERTAIEGSLHELEAAWREAEKIAEISDSLLIPAYVAAHLARLKRSVTEDKS